MAELSTLGSVIKTAYESQSNTNAYTNTDKSVIAGLNTSTYLGNVATNCGKAPGEFFSGNKEMMSYTMHYARERITTLQGVIGNWYATAMGSEIVTGFGTSIQRLSIEYPLNTTPQEFAFAGVTGGATVLVGDQAISDVLTLTTPIPYGARFRIRRRYTNTSGIIFKNQYPSSVNFAQGVTFGVTTPDTTLSSAEPTYSQQTIVLPPLALVANTRRPSILLLGDSRVDGSLDTIDYTYDIGDLARSVGQAYGYINLGLFGDSVVAASASFNKRASLAQYCSAMVIAIGTNDIINNGRSAAQVFGDLTTIMSRSEFSHMTQRIACTITPRTTGTYTTEGGQTLQTNAVNQATYNDLIRAGTIPAQTNMFDIDEVMSSGRNTGKWYSSNGVAFTNDGVHANKNGTLRVKQSGVIALSAFLRN